MRSQRVAALPLRGEGVLVLVVGVFTALLSTQLGRVVSSDGWLSLLAGRIITRSGLPSHNTLTVLGHGRRWVDQQWLAQLLLYGTERLGGLTLVVALQVFLVVGAFMAALVLARRRGARASSVAIVGAAAILPLVITATPVRSESFTYLLFVALVALVLEDGAFGARRTLLVLGLLVLWANLHGSVLLAAAIVMVRGVYELRASHEVSKLWVSKLWPLLLTAGPVVCVFVSPYAFRLPHYYATTAFNPTFGTYLAQWGPSGLMPLSVPLFALALGSVWLLGRTADTYVGFERALLALAVVVGLLAVRNWPWLVLTAMVLVPRGLDAIRRARADRAPSPSVDLGLAFAGAAILVLSLATGLSGLGKAQRDFYPPQAADRVAASARARPGARIFAGVRFGDWLLWRHPELAGRLVSDVRYELLTSSELERTALFRFGAGTEAELSRSGIFVLDPETDDRAITALDGHVSPTFATAHVWVALTRIR